MTLPREQVAEKDTFSISADGRVTMSGRDDYGGNLMVVRFEAGMARKLRPISPAMLDGVSMYAVENVCRDFRTTCVR